MIELKLSETTYKLPANWNDVSFKKYCGIVQAKGKDLIERLAVYSGVPRETLDKISLNQLNYISGTVEFMDFPETIEAFSIAYESDMVIGDEMYWRVENAKQEIQKNKDNPILAGVEIIKAFTADKDGNGGEDISDTPVTEVIGRVAFFLRSCQSFGSGSKG